MKKVFCSLWLILCATLIHGHALAEEKNVRFFVTPYAWLISLSGNVEAKGYNAKVDASFTDLTEHLNFAGMLAIDAIAYNRFGFTANINAAMLGDSSSVRGVALDSKSRMLLSDAALFYRLGSTPLNDTGSMYIIWDILAGARLWDLKAKLDVGYGPRTFKVSQHETWIDPIIGGKAWVHLSDDWGLEFRADIGGFDISSKNTWSASALVGYTIWRDGRLLLGYRAVGVDYQTGSGSNKFKADAILHGPMAGLSFRF